MRKFIIALVAAAAGALIAALIVSHLDESRRSRNLAEQVDEFVRAADRAVRQERYDDVAKQRAELPEEVRRDRRVEREALKAELLRSASTLVPGAFGMQDLHKLEELRSRAESLDKEENGASPETAVLLGIVDSLLDDPADAQKEFKESLRRDQSYAPAYNDWGYTIVLWRCPEEGSVDWAAAAEEKFKRAIELNAHYEWPQINLGTLAVWRSTEPSGQDYTRAEEEFEKAERIAPWNPNASMDSAACLVELGIRLKDADPTRAAEDFGRANEKLRQAARLGLHSADLETNWGLLFKATGNTKQALASYRDAFQLDHESVEACADLAELEDTPEKRQEAINLYRQCRDLAERLGSQLSERAAKAPDACAAQRLRTVEGDVRGKSGRLSQRIAELAKLQGNGRRR